MEWCSPGLVSWVHDLSILQQHTFRYVAYNPTLAVCMLYKRQTWTENDRQFKYNVTLKRVRAAIVAAEK